MTKQEALKILDELVASIGSYNYIENLDNAKLDDWQYDIIQVCQGIEEGLEEDTQTTEGTA